MASATLGAERPERLAINLRIRALPALRNAVGVDHFMSTVRSPGTDTSLSPMARSRAGETAKPESTDGEGAADMGIWWKCLLICGDSYW